MQAYTGHIAKRIRANRDTQVLYRYERAKTCLDPLLSCFVNDCLDRGVDIEEGGARYNWIMPSFVGLANAADGLAAIRTLVFEKKAISLATYIEALDHNFENDPALLARIRELPGYGNHMDVTEGSPEWYVETLSTFLAGTCDSMTVPFSGGRLIPSLFCWIMHDQFGQQTGATPDGRLYPENYRDLVVRIGGYSDYFTRLTPTMQEEVIRRTTHTI